MKTDIKNLVSKLTKEEAEIVTRLLKDKAVIKKNRRMELVSVEAEGDDVTTNTGPCIGFETDEEADRWEREHSHDEYEMRTYPMYCIALRFGETNKRYPLSSSISFMYNAAPEEWLKQVYENRPDEEYTTLMRDGFVHGTVRFKFVS